MQNLFAFQVSIHTRNQFVLSRCPTGKDRFNLAGSYQKARWELSWWHKNHQMFATFLTSKLLSLRPWPLFRLPGTKHGFVLDGMMVGILVGGFSWLPCFSQYSTDWKKRISEWMPFGISKTFKESFDLQ